MDKNKVNIFMISKKMNVSKSHLYDVLSGKVSPGKQFAKKIGRITGRPYLDILGQFDNGAHSDVKRELFEKVGQI